MRKILCMLLLLCVVSFAEDAGKFVYDPVTPVESPAAASSPEKEWSFCGGLLMDVSAGTHWADLNVSIAWGTEIWKNTFLMADFMNFHVITDIEDSTSRISALNSLITLGLGVPLIFTASEKLSTALFVIDAFLNPTFEYNLWREKALGVSLSAGYKTDWFAFSPDHALYFKPHAEINVDIFILRVSASYAYVVTNTYDISRGSRFYLKIGISFYGS